MSLEVGASHLRQNGAAIGPRYSLRSTVLRADFPSKGTGSWGEGSLLAERPFDPDLILPRLARREEESRRGLFEQLVPDGNSRLLLSQPFGGKHEVDVRRYRPREPVPDPPGHPETDGSHDGGVRDFKAHKAHVDRSEVVVHPVTYVVPDGDSYRDDAESDRYILGEIGHRRREYEAVL